MEYFLKEVTPPTVEPLLVGGDVKLDVKVHLRLDAPTPEVIACLNNLIKAARRWAENFTSRFFIEQTWDLLLPNGFPNSASYTLSSNEIRIPRVPLKAVGGITHVKYLDTAGVQQTLVAGTDYVVAARGEAAIILPAYGKSWPATRQWIDASGNYPVEVRFIAGYGTTGTTVPENYRQAMLLHVEAGYDRDPENHDLLMERAEALLSQDRFSPW